MEKFITNFAINLDKKTEKQFEQCCNQNFVVKASLMPDAHLGYVAPIGSVLITKDYIVPSWVGYDIGCGMIALKIKENLNNIIEKKYNIFNKVKEKIPMGVGKLNHIKNISLETKIEFKKILEKYNSADQKNEEIFRYIKNKGLSNLGTLGSGNHFIEIGKNSRNEVYLIIHSGSRGIGKFVATYYMKKISQKEKGFENTFPIDSQTKLGKEYLSIVDFCLDFALLNRLEIANKVLKIIKEELNLEKINYELWANKNHNHVLFEKGLFIHRKGATPAKKKEKGIIPANMRDGCFLVEGLGNKNFLESSSHGAGRKLSRKEAKKKISLKNFQNSMKNILGEIKETIIDEAPEAYKNIFDVMEAQKDSVKIIEHIKPIINWKGE